jgi:hypothetical protein
MRWQLLRPNFFGDLDKANGQKEQARLDLEWAEWEAYAAGHTIFEHLVHKKQALLQMIRIK